MLSIASTVVTASAGGADAGRTPFLGERARRALLLGGHLYEQRGAFATLRHSDADDDLRCALITLASRMRPLR